MDHEKRCLGKSDLQVTPVAFGTWPIAGVTSLDVNDQESLDTIRACADLGINFIDTAYCYGPNGESENLLRTALAESREKYVIATKCGIHYGTDGKQAQDARPEQIRRECDASLQRLGTDHVELYYLHAPDPQVPVAESAGAIGALIDQGKVLYAGASNCQLDQIQEFHAACPLTAVQLPYNMLQRDIQQQTIPWCLAHEVGVVVYWALMKGLLAGKLRHQSDLAPEDNRRGYPMYQGQEWQRNQAFVEILRTIAAESGRSVAEVVIEWTFSQPGITAVLCGAKRRWQLAESAAAMRGQLSAAQLQQINLAIEERGKAETRRLFQ
jgi:aryl-alcohol dehydrogenase-like predicted oxidoreductase